VTGYLIAAVICFSIGWSVAAAEALFRLEERPPPFQNRPGVLFLLALSAVGAALGTGGVLWAFQARRSSLSSSGQAGPVGRPRTGSMSARLAQ
jgi:hypothetical protein